ncbi:MAG: AAA family ATPase [Planctomycetes bacterium]|nr:AAA family ATPase [Planctomycetota bacterium]
MLDELERWVRAAEAEEEGALARLAEELTHCPATRLADCAQHRSAHVRSALARALTARAHEELAPLALTLARDREGAVRLELAKALAAAPTWGSDELYRVLLDDAEWTVRDALASAACERESLRDDVLIALVEDQDDDVRSKLAARLAQLEPTRALPGLIENIAGTSDSLRRACAIALEHLIKSSDGLPSIALLPARDLVQRAASNLRQAGRRRFARVIAELERRAQNLAGAELPDQRGVDLTREARAGRLERAFEVESSLEAVLAVLERPTRRAAVLLGDSGVGKTAVVHELVQRLLADPRGAWLVVRMAPSDFLIGTTYLGEWQSALQKLIEFLSTSRRTLLVVPAVHQLSRVGSTSKSDDSVASMLAPHIESGALAVLGESTPEEFAAGLGRGASARSAWTQIDVPPATPERTLRILRAICAERRVAASDALLERLLDYAEMLLPNAAQPGRAAGLLRRVLESSRRTELGVGDVLAELSRTSGVPTDLVDDEVALDLERLRQQLGARIMGQPESIEAVLDVVALIKAGLTDPQKPLSTLFFVGPTGVGKTELARALAERVFGDPARLLRLDMSEYASHDSYERLIGARGGPGTLTQAVRERPFGVILFDEIEKANVNVFDLLLQVLDAGRLTDGTGRTADFRRSILIMTSNVGSAVPSEGPLGFGEVAPRAPDEGEVLRAMRAYFRPEFLNRIDRVVVFRPLALETAERIAQRELAAVLKRGGIERRGLTLDVDPEVTALLLRRGYNQAFGARPLKRTVERLVLQPVARAIASGAASAGSVLRVSVRGDEIDVRILEAETGREEQRDPTPSADSVRVRQRAARVVARADRVEATAQSMRVHKSELVAASNSAGFWDRRHDALRTLDALHRVEALLGRVDGFALRARACAEQAMRAKHARMLAELDERAAGLELEAELLERLLGAREPHELADAWVVLTEVKSQSEELAGVDKLTRMYLEWAKRLAFEAHVVSDRCGGDPHERSVVLELLGAGAHALLHGESGLHVVQSEAPRSRARPAPHGVRAVVRVQVLRAVEALDERYAVDVRALSNARGRWLARPSSLVVARDPSTTTSVTLWSEREPARAREDAVSLLAATLAARAARKHEHEAIVRRYELSPVPRVRGQGRQAKLARVLAGDIDLFLVAADAR